MSMDNSGQTLEQLKKHIPDLINVQPFNESLASCLANIFQINLLLPKTIPRKP